MVCKLFAIIECDGMDMFLEWCEQFYAGFSHQLGGFAFNLGDEVKPVMRSTNVTMACL